MGTRAVHFSPLSRSSRQTAQGNIFLTSKVTILGDLLHHTGGKQCVSTTKPSYGSIWLLPPPQLTLTSVPRDSVLNGWEGSCLSTVHHTLQSIRTPRWLHPFFPCAVTARPAASCLLRTAANMGLQMGWGFKAIPRACE